MATGSLDRLRGADFLDISQLDRDQLLGILDLAGEIKAGRWSGAPLEGRRLALVFQQPSMRTRVSFQVGIERLGGSVVTLTDQDIGLGRREAVADVARVLERYVDGIVARLFAHRDVVALATHARCPVINALTDGSHPCQVLADLLTIRESLGRLNGSVHVAFVGDGNNVARSLMEAAGLLEFELSVISPSGRQPRAAGPGCVHVTDDLASVAGAQVIYTDVWTSMGQEGEAEARRAQFAPYRVDRRIMEMAPAAIFMHCLPAHRGEEVAADVIDGPRSVVFQQAENRLHAQMALMALIFGPRAGQVPEAARCSS